MAGGSNPNEIIANFIHNAALSRLYIISIPPEIKPLFQQAFIVNVLRNTSPDVVAGLINVDTGNTTSGMNGIVTAQPDGLIRQTPNGQQLPRGIGYGSNIKLLGRNVDATWIYIAVSRSLEMKTWYDYGWMSQTILNSTGDINTLPVVGFGTSETFALEASPTAGISIKIN